MTDYIFRSRSKPINRPVSAELSTLPIRGVYGTDVLEEMDEKLDRAKNPFAGEGRWMATYDLEIPCGNERYLLT